MMSHEKDTESSSLKGIGKIFNGRTIKGRAHVSMATYAVIGGLIYYFMTKPPRPPSDTKGEEDDECLKFSSYNLPPL
ncbi:uncharacterized protein LOC123314228 [Coccinella septempunctata]|uniref:uncharacterized protein LOC123314228 n=1 Tax=Coccinella septempunctata TaxID=41139 RepID=UPI001D05F394|nr:uncharacterized protein LOC123314228 [Coccinella septempunctata]